MNVQPFVIMSTAFHMTDNLFCSNWLYLVPGLLLLYSVIMWCFGDNDLQTNIKRIYYSVYILGYFIFIKYFGVSNWCENGSFGISPPMWSLLLSIIVAFLIAITIDNFIISGYVFKEFGFFGAKFIKEETKKTVIDQSGYMLNLEKSLEALYDVFYYIHKIFLDPQTLKELKKGTFDYPLQFTKILKNFYDFKTEYVSINVKFYKTKPNDINSLIKDYAMKYNMKKSERRELKSCIAADYGNSRYFDLNNTKIFVITAKIKHSQEDEMLLISIQSKSEINLYDIYPILSFLNYFELEISKI